MSRRGISLRCHVCGGETRVYDSRRSPSTTGAPNTAIRRRRVCIECETKFTTIEMRADLAALPASLRTIRRLRADLAEIGRIVRRGTGAGVAGGSESEGGTGEGGA